jgi:hypothetical protein
MKLNLFLLSAAAMVNAATATVAPDLKTAGAYVMLAKSGITNVPTSTVVGNIGVSPITAASMTGWALTLAAGGQHSTSAQVEGECHGASYGGDVAASLTVAVLDMQNAYTDASSRLPDPNDPRGVNYLGGLIGGETLTPGVYAFTTAVPIYDDLTFDAQGDADAVFIVKTTGVLTLAANKEIILANGAQAKNVFWVAAGNAAIGAGASMAGIMLIFTDVLFITGSSMNGRIFAQTAIALQMATIMAEDEVVC